MRKSQRLIPANVARPSRRESRMPPVETIKPFDYGFRARTGKLLKQDEVVGQVKYFS